MINKIKDIPDGTDVWVKMKRIFCENDNTEYSNFEIEDDSYWLRHSAEVFTEEEMRERFSERALPNEGDIIETLVGGSSGIYEKKTVAYIAIIANDSTVYPMGQWRLPPKKIQKTIAELEKELGYDEGTLEITN